MRVNQFFLAITSGLGYCCAARFFSLYTNNETIAARLGYSARTVRRQRAGATPCAKCKEALDGDTNRIA